MRVLLIKTSSMGDVIHTLPALTDAERAIQGISFDWMVEESFAEIPLWHPSVSRVIPIALRDWRKQPLALKTRKEWANLRQTLKSSSYDIILDAQGLVKSAFLTFLAKGERVGLDFRSAREGIASLAYQRKCTVNFYQHAVIRMRSLFSQALGYALPPNEPVFGLNKSVFRKNANPDEKYVVFLHGTTWTTKEWPEAYWTELAKLASLAGYRIKISGGNARELERAKRIASGLTNMDVLPRLEISEMAQLLANAQAAVAVDTGFGHLAGALDVPTVSLYGPTNAAYTGALGQHSVHLSANFPCAPCLSRTCSYKKPSAVTPACFSTVTPSTVWQSVLNLAQHNSA